MELVVGQAVKFVDPKRRERDALVTYIHAQYSEPNGNGGYTVRNLTMEEFKEKHGSYPCINVVAVMLDEDRKDPYGQQSEHYTSVSYRSPAYEVAGGLFYFLPEERK